MGSGEASLSFDRAFFEEFEKSFDTIRPEKSPFRPTVIAFGEISSAMILGAPPEVESLVFKRLPIFRSLEEAQAHERLCREYVRLVSEEADVAIPATRFFSVQARGDLVVFYAAQERVPGHLLGRALLCEGSDEEAVLFFELVLRELEKIWWFNASQKGSLELTLDLQLSNWALAPSEGETEGIHSHSRLVYIDVTTPLMRKDGVEQIDSGPLFRSCPSWIRWPVERFLGSGVISRYYDPRSVVIDVLANCIKEGREDILLDLLNAANKFFWGKPVGLEIERIRMKEVYRYYREDALIWMTFLGLRKLDRFVKTSVMGKPYDFMLPKRIERNIPWRNRPPGVSLHE